MTDKEKFELKIKETSLMAFDWTPKMYDLYSSDLKARVETVRNITLIIGLLKFLIWVGENLFNDEGKFSLPIWKWPQTIKAIREFIKL